jgi:2-oxo-4-hydroxy-4-carboxy-5-ureidoimidazoline decarboxylase
MMLAEVNAMNAAQFEKTFGDIAEHSPWVAARAFKSPQPGRKQIDSPSPVPLGMGEGGRRPDEGSFTKRDEMIDRFIEVVMQAPKSEQLSLLIAHPDLATRAKLTQDSTREQQGAGLDMLNAVEFAKFNQLNNQYKEQNGFPFIFAVKGATKNQILEGFETRIHNNVEVEFKTALAQVCRIIRFRLEDRVSE